MGVNGILYVMRHGAVTNMQLNLFKITRAGLTFAHTECGLECVPCSEKQCAHLQDEGRILHP